MTLTEIRHHMYNNLNVTHSVFKDVLFGKN